MKGNLVVILLTLELDKITFPTRILVITKFMDSKDFYQVMKAKFDLSELGLWFSQPRTSKSSEFNKERFVLHIEIDRKDVHKRAKMEAYFNHSANSLDSTFFGTPMLLTKPFDYFADDDVKENVDNHARRQASLGKALRSITITGIQLCNWSNSKKTSTLFRDLMEVEIIAEKKVIKSKLQTPGKIIMRSQPKYL